MTDDSYFVFNRGMALLKEKQTSTVRVLFDLKNFQLVVYSFKFRSAFQPRSVIPAVPKILQVRLGLVSRTATYGNLQWIPFIQAF